MATRRQREAAAPRPAANAGSRNQTTAAAAAAATSGPRNETTVAAARSGPRNQTSAAAAATSGPRNQTTAAAAAATCRPHARNRRALGDMGNHVNAPVVDREANRRRLTRSLSARSNAATADENAIALARAAAVEGASASRAVSGDNKKVSKGATTRVTRTRAKTDATADYLVRRVAAAEARVARAVEEMESTASQLQVLNDSYAKLAGDYRRYELFVTEATQTIGKLHATIDKKESELQKVFDLNVKLLRVVDQKEAQLQALSEQCKALALNSK